MNRSISVLTTGGTIGHRSAKSGVAEMGFNPIELFSDIRAQGFDLDFKEILRKGSMDIGPDDWKAIAAAAADAVESGAHGVIILHGTDTMHYTAAALSFMLQSLSVPIVLTGSMIPGGDAGSDALPNLQDAIQVAAHADLAEVCVVFSADAQRERGVIIRGTRARKVHSHAVDAFASINAAPLGYIRNNAIAFSELERSRRTRSKLSARIDIDPNVALIKLHPAMTPGMLAAELRAVAGAVLEGTGIGHIKTDLQEVVTQFKKPAVISTQALYGGERLGGYEVDRHILDIPNIIPTADMTSEAAVVKLMWSLRQGGDIRSIMQSNIAGEISPQLVKARPEPAA
jgi:glutamyl-tRNA(Gln) amidotransferase subunit D